MDFTKIPLRRLNNKNLKNLIVILIFFLSCVFVFRNYFFRNSVPFAANLLVSFYEPWVSYNADNNINPQRKPIGYDSLRIYYPFRKFTIESIKAFEWPLWNPYVFSGNVHLATYQSAVFFPLSILFFLLPQIDAWSLIVILQPFLASIFMYIFLREINLTRKSSLFGSLVFAFSGLMISGWEESFMSIYSGLLLPIILYAISKLYKKVSSFNFLLLTFCLSFSILSGWFQTALYVWGFSIAWALYKFLKTKKLKIIFLLALAYLLSIFISAIHLFPSIEAYIYSARGSTDAKFIFDTYLMPLYHLITFLAPDFFGNPAVYNYFGQGFYYESVIFVGIPALIFGLYAIFCCKDYKNDLNFMRWAFLVTLSLGFSLPTSWFILYYLKLPLISVILPSRIFFLSTFSISVLSAFGIQFFLEQKNKKNILVILFGLGVIFACAWAMLLTHTFIHPPHKFVDVPLRNLVIPSIIFTFTSGVIILAIKNSKLYFKSFIVLLSISLVSSFYFSNKYLDFSSKNFVYPQTPLIKRLENFGGIDRFWRIGDANIERNFSSYFNLYSPEGYDSLYIRRYGELLYSFANQGKLSNQIPRADATLTYAKNISDLIKNNNEKKLLSLLGVRYLVEKKRTNNISNQILDDSSFIKTWEDKSFIIYEYKDVIPRIFLAGKYEVIQDSQKIIDFLISNKTNLRNTVILEKNPDGFSSSDIFSGSVSVLKYTPNKITVQTNSNSNSILFLSDNFYPGWKAYVDGQKKEIYRADYAFRAVIVPSGTHKVVFEYKPESFYIGILTSLSALLISLLISIRIKARANKL